MKMQDILNISWGGDGFPEYGGEAHSKPSDAEKTAQANETADRTAREGQVAQMGSDLSDVEGGQVTDTPMYKRVLGLSTESTSRAYDTVRSKRASAARRSGFGYNQPLSTSDASTTDIAEAGDLGDLPRSTAESVMPYRMEAAGMRGSTAGTYNSSASSNMSTWANTEQSRLNRRAAMIGKLAGLGTTAATTFIPHG